MLNINPKRLVGEKFAAFKERQRQVHKAIKAYLKGRVVRPSSEIVLIPVLGKDDAADKAVINGQYRDVIDVTLKNGTETRIGRTKGVPWRSPAAERPSHKRRVRRQIEAALRAA